MQSTQEKTSKQNKKLWQTFFVFLLPLIATNILQNLSGTINTVFVGQMIGVDAIASISVFFPILFCLMAFIIGVSTGATILIGQAWGAKDYSKLSQIVGSTLFLTLIGGSIIACFGAYFTPEILGFLKIDEKLLTLAIPYTRAMLIGSPLLFMYIVYTSILRGVGDSITPLIALILSSFIGLIVTPAFIQGYFGLPKMGILSPAIATYISNIVILSFLYWYLNKKNHPLAFNKSLRREIRFRPEMAKLILKLGVPTGIQMITASLAGLVIVGLVNGFGATATAAYGAVNQVLNYVQFPAISIGIATSIFAAQAIGAGHSEQLKKVTQTALLFNLVLTGGLILLVYLFSEHLMYLFINENEVIVLGQMLLHIVVWAFLFFGANNIFASIMRASGQVFAPMVISILTIIVVELPFAIFLSNSYGLKGIWYAYAISFVLGFFMQFGYYWFVWRKQTVKKLI